MSKRNKQNKKTNINKKNEKTKIIISAVLGLCVMGLLVYSALIVFKSAIQRESQFRYQCITTLYDNKDISVDDLKNVKVDGRSYTFDKIGKGKVSAINISKDLNYVDITLQDATDPIRIYDGDFNIVDVLNKRYGVVEISNGEVLDTHKQPFDLVGKTIYIFLNSNSGNRFSSRDTTIAFILINDQDIKQTDNDKHN
jgi:hypothetical protein